LNSKLPNPGHGSDLLNIFLHSGLVYVDGGVTAIRWRFPVAFQIIPLIFLLAIVWFFPESPRWLTKVGREDEAFYVLQRLRGDGSDPADQGKAQAEFEDIRNIAELEKTSAHRTSYWSMLTGKGSGKLHTGRRVQLVIWLQIVQEWVGIAGVTICLFPYDIQRWDSGTENFSQMHQPFSELLALTRTRVSG
jgi:Sugar (and other) transporter